MKKDLLQTQTCKAQGSLPAVGASTRKPLSVLLTHILSAIKGKLSKLSSIIYSCIGINKMDIQIQDPEIRIPKLSEEKHKLINMKLVNEALDDSGFITTLVLVYSLLTMQVPQFLSPLYSSLIC